MNYIGTQNFETKRCFLRRIKLSDYTMMYENWAKYDEVCRYYPFNPVDDIEIYRDKVKHWISNYESDSYFHWVIEWKETGELVGTINLGNVEVLDANFAKANKASATGSSQGTNAANCSSKPKSNNSSSKNKFNNFNQRNNDYDKLEKLFLNSTV